MGDDFFPPLPPPPEAQPHAQPEWAGPPDNALGRFVDIAFVLARTDEVAVVVDAFRAYPTGCLFEVSTVARPGLRLRAGPWTAHPHQDDAEVLRLGVEFADGRRAIEEPRSPGPRGDASRPTLSRRSGGGAGGRYTMERWLWPLPPAGPLTFACRWPAYGIELTRHTVDAAPLVAAAARVWRIWEE